METKVKVYGKAQNRTALGIMHAYMELYPKTTLDELKRAFPDSLNPDSGVKSNFKTLEEIKSQMDNINWNGYFADEDCLLTMQNGLKVAVVSMWTKPSYERLVAHARQYGIEVAKMDAVDKGFGKKGGYSLEFVKTETPKVTIIKPMLQTKKKSKSWIWILAALLIIILLLALLLMRWKKEPEVITVVQRDTLTVVQKDTVTVVKIDTVYVQQVEEIAKDFNAAQFKVGSYELNDNAKFALHDLANVMIKNLQLQLLIKGHTSDEGNADYNQRLSENRAKAAVDFLVSQGVDRSRLTYEGKGSSEPIDPDNRELNRRTEFIIVNN